MTFSSLSETTIQRIEALRGALTAGNSERVRFAAVRLSNALDELDSAVQRIAAESLPPLTEYDPGVAPTFCDEEIEAGLWAMQQENRP